MIGLAALMVLALFAGTLDDKSIFIALSLVCLALNVAFLAQIWYYIKDGHRLDRQYPGVAALSKTVAIVLLIPVLFVGCSKSVTSASAYDKLTVVLQQPGVSVAAGHNVCLQAIGGAGPYTWSLKRGFGFITQLGCFVLTTSDAYEVEVASGDGQRASISTPVLPPLPSVCNVGTVVVLSNNQNGAEYIQRPDGATFGWLGTYSAQDAQLGTWAVQAQDLAGFTKVVSPTSGNVTGCGILVFVVTYTPVR
jgi:hypothetical protein